MKETRPETVVPKKKSPIAKIVAIGRKRTPSAHGRVRGAERPSGKGGGKPNRQQK